MQQITIIYGSWGGVAACRLKSNPWINMLQTLSFAFTFFLGLVLFSSFNFPTLLNRVAALTYPHTLFNFTKNDPLLPTNCGRLALAGFTPLPSSSGCPFWSFFLLYSKTFDLNLCPQSQLCRNKRLHP